MAGDVGREDRNEARRLSAREIAQRNLADDGKPLNPVMKAAATACELAQSAKGRRDDTRG
jgi:hypothetical protein